MTTQISFIDRDEAIRLQAEIKAQEEELALDRQIQALQERLRLEREELARRESMLAAKIAQRS
jgi:hypothetical protein